MPLPLIIGGIALAAAGYGVKKGVDAYSDNKEAEEFHTKAKDEYQGAERALKEKIDSLNEVFEAYGERKKEVYETTLLRYESLISQLEIEYDVDNVDFEHIQEEIAQFDKSFEVATAAVTGIVGGTIAGGLAGLGAYGGVGLLGAASTGTAISSLSGAAATNATLAWLGGGSLAAGGFGIAGGTAVLGGIIAAPVILVAGSIFASMAEKNKYDALAYYTKVRSLVETMLSKSTKLNLVMNKVKEKMRTLANYNYKLLSLINIVESIMNRQGTKVKFWESDEQKKLESMVDLAKSIVGLINSPALDENDALTKEVVALEKQYDSINKEIQERWGKK